LPGDDVIESILHTLNSVRIQPPTNIPPVLLFKNIPIISGLIVSGKYPEKRKQ
jgi:hypothetical protein